MKKLFYLLTVFTLIYTVNAAERTAPTEKEAIEFIEQLIADGKGILQEPQTKHREKMNALLEKYFDTEYICRMVLGPLFKEFLPEQFADFCKYYKSNRAKYYSSTENTRRFGNIKIKGKIMIVPNKHTTVPTVFTFKDQNTETTVEWIITKKEGKIKVIGVVVEGVNETITDRPQMAERFKRAGSAAKMLEELKALEAQTSN